MKKHILKGLLVLSLSVLLALPYLFSAAKGTLRVQVFDAEDSVLPGAEVSISSPDMMGIKTLVTGERGEAVFIGLFPSVYEVKTTLEGFQEVIFNSYPAKVL